MSLPLHMRADDPAAADPARRRLIHKSHLLRFPSFPSRHPKESASLPLFSYDTPVDDIHIDDARLPIPTDDKDVYSWATLYENQRGITLFSTPLYSSHSLLPSDPHPFTIPGHLFSRKHLPNLSLDTYPFPDGTWRWVSTAWMIDMRSELGEVQPDGFEYNWCFRDTHWHGKPTAGAWVRRRRWVRLMMHPSRASHNHATFSLSPSPSPSPPSTLSLVHQWSGVEQDWQHVHRLLKQLGRDGRKLELWRIWLTPYVQTDLKGKRKAAPSPPDHLSDVIPENNPPPLGHLVAILGNHGEAILRSFVFPDSRAQFVHLVTLSGLEKDLERGLGRAFSTADVDFWSYADDLDRV